MFLRLIVTMAFVFCFTSGLSAVAATSDDYETRVVEFEDSIACCQNPQYYMTSDNYNSSEAYAGFSFVFSKLHYHESFQAIVSDDLAAPTSFTLVPFDEDFELTPRVWLGMTLCGGLGARVSYWNYDHGKELTLTNAAGFVPSANATSVIFPATITTVAAGDTLTVNTSQVATTLDFEGTYHLQIDRMELLVSGGLRYVNTEQTYAATTVVAASSLNFIRAFEGIGPTFSATGRIPVGDSGLYGVGSAGLSFLFGEKTLRRNVVGDVTPLAVRTPASIDLSDADEITGAYRAAIGVGYERCTCYGNTFIEAGYEGQLWTSGGAPTLTFMGFNGLNLSIGLSR